MRIFEPGALSLLFRPSPKISIKWINCPPKNSHNAAMVVKAPNWKRSLSKMAGVNQVCANVAKLSLGAISNWIAQSHPLTPGMFQCMRSQIKYNVAHSKNVLWKNYELVSSDQTVTGSWLLVVVPFSWLITDDDRLIPHNKVFLNRDYVVIKACFFGIGWWVDRIFASSC